MAPRTPIRALDAAVLSALPEDVWRVVADVRSYPLWYPRWLSVRVDRSFDLVGTRLTMRPWGGRSFTCVVAEAHPLRSLLLEYDGAFIQGRGAWRIEAAPGGTRIAYALDAVAVGRAAALVGRVVSLSGIHSASMRSVLRALAREVARRIAHRLR